MSMRAEHKQEVRNLLFGIGVDSYNRFPEFYFYRWKLTHSQYWYGLRLAYTDSDDLLPYSHLVKKCFYSRRPYRHNFMEKEDRQVYDTLPSRVTIYRGMTEKELHSGAFGVSWSLSRKVAEFFAYQYVRNHSTADNPKTVHTLTVDKTNLIGYYNGREEQEVFFLQNL